MGEADGDRPKLKVIQGSGGPKSAGSSNDSPHLSEFERRISAGQLGLLILLISLSMLFAATVVGFLVIRYRTVGWANGLPSLPSGLWVSTAMLLVVSGLLHLSVRAARAGDDSRLLSALLGAMGFAVIFLLTQGLNWWHMVAAEMPPDIANLYAFTFYLLTGTHAAHVIGGLVPLAVTLVNARAGRYRPESHEGVRLTAQYWHFLDVVWLILLAVMLGTA